jgi:hypothetical protein
MVSPRGAAQRNVGRRKYEHDETLKEDFTWGRERGEAGPGEPQGPPDVMTERERPTDSSCAADVANTESAAEMNRSRTERRLMPNTRCTRRRPRRSRAASVTGER